MTSLLLLPQFRSGCNFAGSTWPRPYHGLKPNPTKPNQKKRALKIDFCRLQQLSHPPAAATPATVAVVADVVVVITRRATVAINKHLAPATASGPRSCPACPSTWACFRLCGGKAIRCYFFFGRGVGKSCISFLCTWKCIIFRPEYSSKFSVIKLSNSVSQVLSSARKLPSIAQLRCIP